MRITLTILHPTRSHRVDTCVASLWHLLQHSLRRANRAQDGGLGVQNKSYVYLHAIGHENRESEELNATCKPIGRLTLTYNQQNPNIGTQAHVPTISDSRHACMHTDRRIPRDITHSPDQPTFFPSAHIEPEHPNRPTRTRTHVLPD